jgi:hypothetical protein
MFTRGYHFENEKNSPTQQAEGIQNVGSLSQSQPPLQAHLIVFGPGRWCQNLGPQSENGFWGLNILSQILGQQELTN